MSPPGKAAADPLLTGGASKADLVDGKASSSKGQEVIEDITLQALAAEPTSSENTSHTETGSNEAIEMAGRHLAGFDILCCP